MAKQAAHIVPALKVLMKPDEHPAVGVCAISGDDLFLKHEVRNALVKATLGDAAEGFGVEVLEGRQAELRDVLDALRERSLFGSSQQVVVIEDADPFVKQYREQLEDLVDTIPEGSFLLLEVGSWPGNTRLAKAVAKSGLTISCSTPDKGAELTAHTKLLKDWLTHLARQEHGVKLDRAAADVLLELLPSESGILCQEIARLALLTEDKSPIDAALVREHVGGWRVRKTWDMIDAVADGNAAEALNQLDRLISAGEDPFAIMPQMASTLRKFAAAARSYEVAERTRRPMKLRDALEQGGIPRFKLGDAEGQLKQIGRPRARQLYRWLLAADLALKGHNSPKDRARREIETLIVRLSKQAAPVRTKT
ncbi:DNA polymerase III subunit delta [Bythopirellula goksoeyrii]|uniref:DNA polymerase III subunit delta n=1 Tax=Bythopirellula goksoeyrii TaxID=1400387 RepID=A0A5B9QGL4_9BACT|nr:DNA polymerase III subunit delta [Bythopirellula goksoeyrii]QEG36722.1 DNA polymerase III subunit delta [Bythopirellula goksoeyrii]